jgi:hypothetical protein
VKTREFYNLGIPKGDPARLANEAAIEAAKTGMNREALRNIIKIVVRDRKDWLLICFPILSGRCRKNF